MRRPLTPARLLAGTALLSLVALLGPAAGATATAKAAPRPAPAETPAAPRALVLYDTTGPWGPLGGTYVTELVKLTGHLGAWVAHPVTGYVPGEVNRYAGVVYLGSTYDEPIPPAFLDDVLSTRVPVLWAGDNIWQLAARTAGFAHRYGYTWKRLDFAPVAHVVYRGTALTRDPANPAGIMDELVTDPAKATVLGAAVRPDGSTFPWAVRSGNLTYVGEVPLSYRSPTDRSLAFADLIFDVLAPDRAARHAALLSQHDVGQDADPARLRAVVSELYPVPPPARPRR